MLCTNPECRSKNKSIYSKKYKLCRSCYTKFLYHNSPRYKECVKRAQKRWRKRNRLKYNKYMKEYIRRRRNENKKSIPNRKTKL